MPFAKFSKNNRLPMLFQTESSECGLASLAMVAAYFGHHVSVAELRTRFPISLKGLSLRDLIEISRKVGLSARPMRCPLGALNTLETPVLLHWDLQHFVVMKAIKKNRYIIHDPAKGVRSLSLEEVSNHFTGVAVGFEPGEQFSTVPAKKGLTLTSLMGSLRGFKWPITQVIALSATLEAIILLQPAMIRSVVDTGVKNGNLILIYQIVGLLLLAAFLVGVISFLRNFTVLRFGTTLNMKMMRRIFNHTLYLPLSFFEKRPIGHLVERYRVTNEIERFLTSSLPTALIDGVMTLLSLSLLFFISWKMALLAITTFMLFFIVRVLGYRFRRSREQELLHAKGEENGYLLETLKGIFTIKTNCLEVNRFMSWQRYYTDLILAQRKHGLAEHTFRSIKLLLIGLNTTVLVFLAGQAMVAGWMTVGTVLGVLFYNSHFILRATTLVDRFFDFLLLEVQLERLEDLVLTQPENVVKPTGLNKNASPLLRRKLTGAIQVENLAFRYSHNEQTILDGIDLDVKAGEFIALVGENGVGKTTLLKLLLGLYPPSGGRIAYDGFDLESQDVNYVRQQISTVSQNDQLFTGSVADNIALFDGDIDLERVAEVAQIAGIDEVIEAMPMGYQTRVGDIGSPFSEGQKQKVFLARALYKNPSILIMDEGTANLDVKSEIRVLENLERLPCTKLFIAHRSATIRRASRVIQLQEGRLVDISTNRAKVLCT